MKSLHNKTIVVAGGTGNVGSFVVKELLKKGAVVAVPSRSAEKINALGSQLSKELDDEHLSRLNTFIGDIGDGEKAEEFFEQITDSIGTPDAAVASLGLFIPAPSLLDATADQLHQVVNGYLIGHFVVARTLLRRLKKRGGTYVFINGPLALEPWEGSGLVSVATAGQRMLFKALAQELKDTNVKVVELISHAFIRNKQTQPESPVPGEAVGAYTSYLISNKAEEIHGETIQLRSMAQLEQAGL